MGPFTGDRGEISAKVSWKDGARTIVFWRKLVTGSEYELQFNDPKKEYAFGVAVFDNAQVRHAFAPGVLKLIFGRLLLTTLHTNDAAAAVPRLADIGVEPYLLASSLTLVAAQRLVRRICPACRESVVLEGRMLETLHDRPDFADSIAVLRREGLVAADDTTGQRLRLYRGRGCSQCLDTGYRRRVAIFELMEIDDTIRPLIRDRADALTIRKTAVARGMKTMFQDGLAKAFLGETTIDEVLRVAL